MCVSERVRERALFLSLCSVDTAEDMSEEARNMCVHSNT